MRHSCLASLFAAYVQDGLLDTTPSFRVVLMLGDVQIIRFSHRCHQLPQTLRLRLIVFNASSDAIESEHHSTTTFSSEPLGFSGHRTLIFGVAPAWTGLIAAALDVEGLALPTRGNRPPGHCHSGNTYRWLLRVSELRGQWRETLNRPIAENSAGSALAKMRYNLVEETLWRCPDFGLITVRLV